MIHQLSHPPSRCFPRQGGREPVQEGLLIRLTGGCVREHRPIQRETSDRQGARFEQTRGDISLSSKRARSWPRCTEPCPLESLSTRATIEESLTLPSSSPRGQQRHCRSVANYHAAALHTPSSQHYIVPHTHTHKLTEGHDRPGKVESHVVDPKVQRLGPAVCHAVHARLVEVGQVV